MKPITVLVLMVFCSAPVSAERSNHSSLFGYAGYVTVPNAYTEDGGWGFHYAYLPKGLAPFHKGKSDNWVFSSTLGFLPFVEAFFSVYVSSDVNISRSIPNYGADKTRSPGIKVRLLQENETCPAVAIGVFDPDVGQASSNTISSYFIVTSKRFWRERATVSIGYGLDTGKKKKYSRLNDIWGGGSIKVNTSVDILGDYDGERWSCGFGFHWKGLDTNVASIQGKSTAFRIGYEFDLLK